MRIAYQRVVKNKMTTIRFTERQYRKLLQLAMANETTVADCVRTLVDGVPADTRLVREIRLGAANNEQVLAK